MIRRRVVLIIENDVIGDGIWHPYLAHNLREFANRVADDTILNLDVGYSVYRDGTTITSFAGTVTTVREVI